MGFKEKVIGFILIVVAAMPLLVKIQTVSSFVSKYSWLMPQAPAYFYQAVIALSGILLLLQGKQKGAAQYR